jgi:hypothetical protein
MQSLPLALISIEARPALGAASQPTCGIRNGSLLRLIAYSSLWASISTTPSAGQGNGRPKKLHQAAAQGTLGKKELSFQFALPTPPISIPLLATHCCCDHLRSSVRDPSAVAPEAAAFAQ